MGAPSLDRLQADPGSGSCRKVAWAKIGDERSPPLLSNGQRSKPRHLAAAPRKARLRRLGDALKLSPLHRGLFLCSRKRDVYVVKIEHYFSLKHATVWLCPGAAFAPPRRYRDVYHRAVGLPFWGGLLSLFNSILEAVGNRLAKLFPWLLCLISVRPSLLALGGLPFLKADHALRWGFELSQTTSPLGRLWRPL
jgi:hypothetical protein